MQLTCGRYRRGDATGSDDVVFLDQDRVVQAHALVVAAAAAHGILLGDAQTRHGLAGIEHAHGRAGHRGDVACRRGSGGRQQLQEVECRPFGGDQRAGVPRQAADQRAGGDLVAVTHLPVDLHRRIQPPETGIEPDTAGDDGGVPADKPGLRLRLCREQGGSGVTLAQILGQGAFDIGGDLGGCGWRETGGGSHSVSVGVAPAAGASSPVWLSLPTIAVIARSNRALAASTRALPSANRLASSRGA